MTYDNELRELAKKIDAALSEVGSTRQQLDRAIETLEAIQAASKETLRAASKKNEADRAMVVTLRNMLKEMLLKWVQL